ncbi:hypothetical protein CMI37_17795 [Candidatus Pacearchaeota archaeon]|nr:hypothetical protein [Candidatus Pacearchaeota archaeon]
MEGALLPFNGAGEGHDVTGAEGDAFPAAIGQLDARGSPFPLSEDPDHGVPHVVERVAVSLDELAGEVAAQEDSVELLLHLALQQLN